MSNEEEDILKSHGVVNLFTNTPTDQVLESVKNRLENESILRDYNKDNDRVQLLDFILTTPPPTSLLEAKLFITSCSVLPWVVQFLLLLPTCS